MKRKLSRKELRLLLLQEAKKELIFERKKRIAYANFVDQVLLENKNLINSKHLLQNEINEGILDSIAGLGGGILGNLFPGFIAQWKQRLVTELLDSMGVDIKSKFAIALINIFEELEWTKLLSYFKTWGEGGCQDFIAAIIRGLEDSIQEAVLEDYFGLNVSGQGNLGGTFREAVTGTINDGLLPYLQEPISKFICNIPMGDVLGKIKDVATGKVSLSDVFKGGLAGASISTPAAATKAATTAVDPRLSRLAQQFGE